MSRYTKRKKAGSSRAVRYVFYLITIAIVAIVPVLAELYMNGHITATILDADASIAMSLFFPFVVFSYLLAKGQRLKDIVKGLGLSKDRISVRNILIGILLFAMVLLTGFLITAFSIVTGIPLPTNVSNVLGGMPLYFFVFTFLIAPIDEEVLFRGFLVPRVGVIASALLFAAPHLLTYASVSEFVVAFAFGLLAGYFFKRHKSLYSTVLAHMLVNLLSVATIAFI